MSTLPMSFDSSTLRNRIGRSWHSSEDDQGVADVEREERGNFFSQRIAKTNRGCGSETDGHQGIESGDGS